MIRSRVLFGAALSALIVSLSGPATAAPESPARRSPVLERIEGLLRHDGVAPTRPATSAAAHRPVAVAEAPDPFTASKGFAGSVPHAGLALNTLTRPASSPPAKATPPQLAGLVFQLRPIDLASAGDVDGNGTTDWVHGEAYFTSGAQTSIGHVFIDRRAPGGAVTTLEIVGPSAFSGFGGSVSSAGDVNGDGFDDLIVGAPLFGSTTGRALVYRGTALGISPSAPWVLDGSTFEEHHGYSVAGAGDVNGDGYDDVVVGAPGASTGGDIIDGRVSCYLGGAGGLSLTPAWTVDGAGNGARMGWSVAGNGDVNADGYADVAVTSPLYSNGQANEGRVQIFLGGPGGLSTTAAFNYESNNANWGADAQVAFPGDVNGDGYGELLVGFPGADIAGADDGWVSIFAGSPFVFSMAELWNEFGGVAGMNFGFDVAPAGDLNGDGFADFLASAPGFPGGLWMENFGSSNFGPTDQYLGVFGTPDKRWGVAMAGGGDHGDGKTSYLIGSELLAPPSPDPAPEAAQGFGQFVVDQFPGRTLNEFPEPILRAQEFAQGSFLETEFGTSMALADVNGDGFSDVIAGGPNYAELGSQQGHVLAWHGGPDGLVDIPPPFAATPKLPSLDGLGFRIPDWSFDGPAPGANFGWSVANAGDVNGDGYDDVIIGALSHSGGAEVNDGAAFLFLGGADGLALSPSWTNEGNENNSFYGYAVGTAGDINQDGYDDILVGAPLASPVGALSGGKTYLYYGSTSGPAHVAARVFNGSIAGAHMGAACTGIGDVDGDGYPEIAMSEVDYANGETGEGRILVYRGGPGGVETLPILVWESNELQAYAGFPVAPAGDVNGDGHADLLVGASNYSDGVMGQGAVYLFLGSTLGLGSAPAQTLTSGVVQSQFGIAVWTAGDLDKDGFGDVIVGSPLFLPPPPAPGGEPGPVEGEGRCQVFFGTSGGLETIARHEYTGGSLGHTGFIGRGVAGGGDVNGDGWPDILFSAPRANSGKLSDNGVLFVGLDNVLAGGLSRPARILRSDNTTPIAHGLRSDLTTSFRVQGQARSLAGRGKVRLQWQAKSPAQPFNATGIGSSSFLRTGPASGGEGSSILLGGTVSGLVSGERYRVRTRIASRHPYFQRSRWFTSARDGLLEMDLRTAGPTGFVAVDDPADAPRALAFAGAAPNPLAAGDGALLRFALPAAGPVTIEAWDVSGRRVARIFAGSREAGPSSVRWDGRNEAGRALPPGLYFLRLVSGGERREAKVVIAN